MKQLLLLLFGLPCLAYSQKVKVNEYDKFIKQQRVEMEPLSVLATTNAAVAINYTATGGTLNLLLSGYGWGASAIDGGNEAILLFANDNTVTVKSTGLQTYEIGSLHNNYKHQYALTLSDLDALSRNDVVGIRKYSFRDYADLKVSKENAVRLKKLSAMFLEELKKAKILLILQTISFQDVPKHIGDSVLFYGKVANAKYYKSRDNKPTILEVSNNTEATPVNVIIWDSARKTFDEAPEKLYADQDVAVKGVISMVNNVPQIIISNKDQIVIAKEPQVSAPQNNAVATVVKQEPVKPKKGKKTAAPVMKDTVMIKDTVATVIVPVKQPPVKATAKTKKGKPTEAEPIVYLRDTAMQTAKADIKDTANKIAKVKSKRDRKAVPDKTVNNSVSNQPSGTLPPPDMPPKDTVINLKPVNKDVQLILEPQIPVALTPLETKARFPGGDAAWLAYMQANLRGALPLALGESKTITVGFKISYLGEIKNVVILKTAGDAFDTEMKRILESMPSWIPYTYNGNPNGISITQKITFLGVKVD